MNQPGVNISHFENEKPHIQIWKNWAPGMHLWDFKRAGMQIWDLCMHKMSDTGNHSESYPIPSSYETISLEPTKPWNNDLHNNVTIKKIKLCLKIDFVCRNLTLGMQISKFRYADMDFFKTPRIQIWFLGKDLVFKYEFLVPFIYPWNQLNVPNETSQDNMSKIWGE